jgi:hypothetical protein
MPRLITKTFRRKKNRYQLTHEEKCQRYWRKFKNFSNFQKSFLAWCESAHTIDRRSRITLNERSVEMICKDSLDLKDLITLCKNNIVLYENGSATNPEGVDVNYLKLMIPSELCHDFFLMFNWISASFRSSSRMKVEAKILICDQGGQSGQRGPTEINKVFGHLRNQSKFIFVSSNFFNVHLWKNFLKLFCSCVPLFFNICVYPGDDVVEIKKAVLRYYDCLRGKSKIVNRLFKTMLNQCLVQKYDTLIDFILLIQ